MGSILKKSFSRCDKVESSNKEMIGTKRRKQSFNPWARVRNQKNFICRIQQRNKVFSSLFHIIRLFLKFLILSNFRPKFWLFCRIKMCEKYLKILHLINNNTNVIYFEISQKFLQNLKYVELFFKILTLFLRITKHKYISVVCQTQIWNSKIYWNGNFKKIFEQK